ncbi:hypothetical protein Bca4012_061169 [Brassica carinata]
MRKKQSRGKSPMKVSEHVLKPQHVLVTKQQGNTWLARLTNFTMLKVVTGEIERLPPKPHRNMKQRKNQ